MRHVNNTVVARKYTLPTETRASTSTIVNSPFIPPVLVQAVGVGWCHVKQVCDKLSFINQPKSHSSPSYARRRRRRRRASAEHRAFRRPGCISNGGHVRRARLLDDVAAQSDLCVFMPRHRCGPRPLHFNQLIKDEILCKHGAKCGPHKFQSKQPGGHCAWRRSYSDRPRIGARAR